MSAVAQVLGGMAIGFAAKAGETGKLYGSITAEDVATAIKARAGVEIKRQQIDMQPIRSLGEHTIHVRLTMDLIPELTVVVFREGEADPTIKAAPQIAATPVAEAEPSTEQA